MTIKEWKTFINTTFPPTLKYSQHIENSTLHSTMGYQRITTRIGFIRAYVEFGDEGFCVSNAYNHQNYMVGFYSEALNSVNPGLMWSAITKEQFDILAPAVLRILRNAEEKNIAKEKAA